MNKSSLLKIELRSISSLIPYQNNARVHSDAQIAQIAASIKEFGFTNPVLLDGENGIIAGHGRVMAARKLGIENVPCIELTYLSEAQKKAYVLADNKLALNATWDDALLEIELQELTRLDFDITLTGFEYDSVAEIIAPDDFPEVDENIETESECPKCGYKWSGGK